MDNSLRGDLPDKVFAEGMRLGEISEAARSFVVARIGFKVTDFIAFLKEHESNSGFVNVDIKVSKNGKQYAELNTYVKQAPPAFMNKKGDEVDTSNIPF